MEDRFAEFEAHIWDHPADAFQIKYDSPSSLTKADVKAVTLVLVGMSAARGTGRPPYTRVARQLFPLVSGDEDVLSRLIQLAGLTGRKIVNDVRPAARRFGLPLPNKWEHVTKQPLWDRSAGPYLVRKLWSVLGPVSHLRDSTLKAVLESVNWATHPGFIRQKRAKEGGHEAERRLASILDACGISFEPAEKLTNPLCNDVLVHGESLDLVVPDAAHPKVCFKSTVHTSPLGEYGKDKVGPALRGAKRSFARRFGANRPLVVALIDGEGHLHNSKALRRVLKISDEFVQFETLWKAVVICGSRSRRKRRIELAADDRAAHEPFLRRYAYLRRVVPPGTLKRFIEAGEARIEA